MGPKFFCQLNFFLINTVNYIRFGLGLGYAITGFVFTIQFSIIIYSIL